MPAGQKMVNTSIHPSDETGLDINGLNKTEGIQKTVEWLESKKALGQATKL
jgi:hypothetical protein